MHVKVLATYEWSAQCPGCNLANSIQQLLDSNAISSTARHLLQETVNTYRRRLVAEVPPLPCGPPPVVELPYVPPAERGCHPL